MKWFQQMHELSICQNILAQVEQMAMHHHARCATRIVLRIGPLSGVVDELLRRAFDLLRPGSVVEKAVLDIQTCPVVVLCPSCDKESQVSANQLVCPHCQQWQTTLISGDELLLLQIEFLPDNLPDNVNYLENAHV